jgi:hypothetical protein
MQWTRERTTWLGTYREKRGTWHHLPYVLRTNTTEGMTRQGWAVLVVAALVVLAVMLIQELWI